MAIKSLFALSAFVLAAGSVLADELPNGNAPLTRAEVQRSVIAARAAGELRPAGEAGDEVWADAQAPRSTLSRAEVRREVIAARAAGELAPAGEAGDEYFSAVAKPAGPGLTRAQVVAETLRARAEGLLAPAGEEDLADYDRMVMQRRNAVGMHAPRVAAMVSGASVRQ